MLTDQQVNTWRNEGAFTLQLPDNVTAPALGWLNENLTQEQIDPNYVGFGSTDRQYEFPTTIHPLDDLVLSEYLIKVVQQLLDCEDIRLLQADLWPKVGVDQDEHKPYDNTDQRIHMDYGNNTLLHPDWYQPDTVAAIIYYDDSRVTAGGTAYVPRNGEQDPVYQPPFIHMPGQAGKRFYNDRKTAEAWLKDHHPDAYALRSELYEREKIVQFTPGTILFYRHDIWHRGTPLKPGTLRRVHNLAWRKADARGWTNWNVGWARSSYIGHVESIIGRSSPLQRSLLDFPLPGDRYWTENRIKNVTARYEHFGFDPAPYLDSL